MAQQFSRTRRVSALVKRELAPVLNRLAAEHRWGMLTLTDVDVSPDLRNARVYVSLVGGEPHAALLEQLQRQAGEMRSHLSRVLRTRVVPRLDFRYDASAERAARMDRLLGELGSPGAAEDDPP